MNECCVQDNLKYNFNLILMCVPNEVVYIGNIYSFAC